MNPPKSVGVSPAFFIFDLFISAFQLFSFYP
jgi:hypothetical protein